MTVQVLTANRLRDGLVVYLSDQGEWSLNISSGQIATNEARAEVLLAIGQAAEAAQEIVGPYLIEIGGDDDNLQPVRYREVVRATGPSSETRGTGLDAEKEQENVSL